MQLSTRIFYGAVIGLTVRVRLTTAAIAGAAAGQALGLGFATSVDRTQGESVLPTTYVFDSLCTLIFLSFICHHVLVAALAASFRAAPIGRAPSAA
jgi:flagellar biosynthetic protein FliR